MVIPFEKEYRKYGEGELKEEYRTKEYVKDNVEKTAAWVAATMLLKHLKKASKNADSV